MKKYFNVIELWTSVLRRQRRAARSIVMPLCRCLESMKSTWLLVSSWHTRYGINCSFGSRLLLNSLPVALRVISSAFCWTIVIAAADLWHNLIPAILFLSSICIPLQMPPLCGDAVDVAIPSVWWFRRCWQCEVSVDAVDVVIPQMLSMWSFCRCGDSVDDVDTEIPYVLSIKSS